MYEDYVEIGNLEQVFKGKTLKQLCEEDNLQNGWGGVYWLCNIIEIDVSKSFLSGTELFRENGDRLDMPELWTVGKESFDSLGGIYAKEIENNQEFELLSYLFFSGLFQAMRFAIEKGQAYAQSQEEITLAHLSDISFFETIPLIIKKIWQDVDNAEKGMLEALVNCQIIRSVDSAAIQYLMGDPGAMSEATEELYTYKRCLDWMKSFSEASKRQATIAAKARHTETNWIKQQVFQYYEEHKHEFKSLRAAALAIEKGSQ